MITRLRRLYKNIDRSHPLIGSLIWRLYHRKPFDTITRKIHGRNNIINYRNAMLASVTFDIDGNRNEIQIKEGCVLSNLTFHVRGDDHSIVIGRKCIFDRGNIWFEDHDCVLAIGEESTFGDVHLALTEPGSKMVIGRDCMFSSDIDIRTGDSHSILSQVTNERINYAADVTIGNHVWIAAHSLLLKGSFIPENSVVAAGSVVTRPFDTKGIVIGGNPAVQLKNGITWSRERIYKTS